MWNDVMFFSQLDRNRERLMRVLTEKLGSREAAERRFLEIVEEEEEERRGSKKRR